MHTNDANEMSLSQGLPPQMQPDKLNSEEQIRLTAVEHARIQAELERSNQKLNEILASIQDDFYVLNRDWVFVYANELFTSRIGKTPEDFVGNNIWEMFPKHIGQPLEENFRAAMKKRELIRFEIPGQYTDAWYRMTVFPSAEGITVLGTDITEQKRVERQLQLLNETLEQKVQEKTAEVRLLAADLIKAVQRERQRISHVLHDDLQQRIYAIQMQLSFLGDGLSTQKAEQELSEIKGQLDEILTVTRQLSIDLSPPILREEGLAHAIHWLASQMRKQYGLTIELQADDVFAIPNEELHVLLFNCIRELLFNVVKHGGASHAVVSLQQSGARLQIEVRDDGKGFPLQPGEPQRSAEVGLQTGLGLPSIHHQLTLFGGEMEIQSKTGGGTRVILLVPVAEKGG